MEKIKRGKNRVNISKLTSADTSGDALTGGYIVKNDKVEGSSSEGWESSYLPYSGAWQKVHWQYHYPEWQDLMPEQIKYIQKYIGHFEDVMASDKFKDSLKNLIDINSFVDYFILTELNRNVDGFRLSAFYYKDKNSKGGKLFAGPVWDMNLGFGNCIYDYYDASATSNWHIDYIFGKTFQSRDEFVPPFWWKKIWDDTGFKKSVALRFISLKTSLFSSQKIGGVIDSLATLLNEAKTRNFQKWPVLGVKLWPNAYVGATYEDEIKYLKNWITSRSAWMSWALSYYTDVDSERGSLQPSGYWLSQNYPNPFNPSTVISYQLPADLYVTLKVYDILGNEVAVLVNGRQSAGIHRISFNIQHYALSTGVYYYRLSAGTSIMTKKMLLIK
jgi:hypothetical protein